jgi:hypothetical protein
VDSGCLVVRVRSWSPSGKAIGPRRVEVHVKASLLDRSRTRVGVPDAEALEATPSRAVHAEQVGYDRYWVAEHHGVPGIASGTPAVLLAAIGARTTGIRIGSGGVMLPLHQPLVVAEQFLALDALFRGGSISGWAARSASRHRYVARCAATSRLPTRSRTS